MKTVICHSFPAWDTPYVKSTLELLTRMAKTHRVIILDYHYTLKDFIKCPELRKNGIWSSKRIMNTDFGRVEVHNALPVIPTQWVNQAWLFYFFMWLNSFIIGITIMKIRRDVSSTDTTVVNAFNPIYGYFTQRYWKNLPMTYYAYDELAHAKWASKWGARFEEKFTLCVNQIIVSSSGLEKKFKRKHDQVKCVKNGVNLAVFSQNLFATPMKKMGYMGAIDQRLDWELISKVAESYPEYIIEMIGPMSMDPPSKLPRNITFTGALPQDQLPQYLAHWKLCLIPFLKTPFTQAIYPLKINEYLAAGKAVVSTEFSDLEEFTKIIRLARDHSSFMMGIKRELRGDNRLKREKRKNFAKQNSWEARTEEFLTVLISSPSSA